MTRTRWLMSTLMLTTALASISKADDSPQEPKPAVQRFLLLTSQGPIVLDAKINIDGKPLGVERERLINEMVSASDRNNDGQTTWDEAIAGGQFEVGRLKSLAKHNPKSFQRRLRMFDEVRNGRVDFSEASRLWALYTGADELVSFEPGVFPTTTPRVPVLFVLLDTDGDRVLSKQEIKHVLPSLRSSDRDHNDVVDARELVHLTGQAGALYKSLPPVETVEILYVNDLQPEFLASQLETMYGKTRDKNGMDPLLIRRFMARIDANDDGKLADDEVLTLKTIEADVELEIELGRTGKSSRPRLVGPSRADPRIHSGEVLTTNRGMSVRLTAIQIQLAAAQRAEDLDGPAQSRLIFRRYDRDKNGYLDKPEIDLVPGNWAGVDFASWDANGDGKVYPDELVKYFTGRRHVKRRSVTIMKMNRGRTLWSWLDVDDDGRISTREMRSAEDRLKQCDRNGDKQISLDEIPSTASFWVLPGRREPQLARRPFFHYPQIVVARMGPEWFIRMDRNGDGDVSIREFLGEASQFKRLDKDGDELIDATEAAGDNSP